jgi:kynurenine formamidase
MKRKLVEMTLPVPADPGAVVPEERTIRQEDGRSYTGLIYQFAHGSMVGTYADFPGHIRETDDGTTAESYPLGKLYAVRAAVIHLKRKSGSGAVTARELQAAAPRPLRRPGGLVINALGALRFDEIENRSVWLSADAVEWIGSLGIHLLISDIYESKGLHGVFRGLFAAGITTICCPINLHRLTAPRVKITCLMLRYHGVTQVPCRILAEF